jgi:uncharacterized membrane protein YfcA
VGVGGGVFFVSFLSLILFMPIDEAIDTSIFIILISSGAGFLSYLKQKRIPIKPTLIFTAFSILGSLTCTIIFLFITIENSILRILFATTLLITGLNMIYKAIKYRKELRKGTKEELDLKFSLKDHDYKKNLVKSIPLFFLAGFVSYLLGIGGGVINTPVLHILLGYPIHNATAISTGMIFFTAIFNTIMKIYLGKINYIVGIFVSIGSVGGAIFGAKISKKMPKNHLQFVVAIVLMVIAVTMYI